ncbi:uncharacterized protein LOC108462437 [Gossypium arboreum]|uniref:uncharacterized protein LOC108462437 n=1 Tax=Gossypium arboreum TaxID=29729 RepID=UPI0008196C3D|nr:uncharacterized protein LOC108462437 [Gossypium arboreum]
MGQKAIILRYVDEKGFIKERFFDLVHVQDIVAITLKEEICVALSRHCLATQNIRGQGYDGASNMRGEWNGLQALFLNDCPYAYCVHCLAHPLQLALVTASRKVIPIHNFFSDLNFILNIISASCKCHDQLQAAQTIEIANMLEIDELETENIIENSSNYSIRGDAATTYKKITSFGFIFILHLVKEIIGITYIICQLLQQKSQDTVNAMYLVSSTKALIQKLREDGWNNLLEVVKAFCEKHNIEVLDMDSLYVVKRDRHQHVYFNMKHHYQVEIFNAAIDTQFLELNSRFNQWTIDLLTLSSALDPKDAYKSFNMDDICYIGKNITLLISLSKKK